MMGPRRNAGSAKVQTVSPPQVYPRRTDTFHPILLNNSPVPTKPPQKQRRLALVSTELGPGGAERCLVNLACRIDRELFDPFVVSLAAPPTDSQSQLVEKLATAGVPVEFLGLSSMTGFRSGIRELARLLECHQADIIQSFLFHANVLTHYANRRSVKAPHFLGVRVADPRKLRKWVERRVAKKSAGVICVSQQVADDCIRFGYPAELVEVIPNGIDLSEFQRTQRQIETSAANQMRSSHESGKQPTFGFLGRLDRQKGAQYLPEIAKAIWGELPQAHFRIAGDGPLRSELHAWATTDDVADRVHWDGWVSNPSEFLAGLDCLLVPSQWEGMANVVLEAMSCEVPVSAYAAEGMQEILGELSDGQLSPLNDSKLLGKNACKFLENQELAAETGARNRTRIEQHFSLDSAIHCYQERFETTLREQQ